MREFTGFSKVVLLLSTLFLLLMFHVSLCNAFLSVPCSLVVAYWEGAGLLALLCVVFSCVFVAFLCCVLGRVWCLVVFFLFCCFTSQVNSYGHCGTVSSSNHTFSWAGLNKRLTSNCAHTFACN